MKPILSQQMQQSLHLTPQLLQSIRLLQLDGMQLELEIQRALEQNPLLELDESPTPSTEEALEEHTIANTMQSEIAVAEEWPETTSWDLPLRNGIDSGDNDLIQHLPTPESNDLHLNILSALALELPPRQWEAAVFWLEHCDDAGYLDDEHAHLLQVARARFALPANEIEAVRQHLLHGDPAGMAACDLRECLQAQLTAMSDDAPGHRLAQRILDDGIELLANHDYPALAARLHTDEIDVHRAVRLIQSLQPRPGETSSERPPSIIPEVMVKRVNGQWLVALNPRCTPRVCVNPAHEKALSSAGQDGAHLRELLQQARGLAHGLEVRHDTLLRTAREIVTHQAAWLSKGDEAMAPLTLKNIADRLGVHESTISRVTTGKYMQTPRGTFELKHFFAVRLDGAAVSGAAVKAMVKRLIDNEPAQRPLADEAIATLLARQGIHIARRTVAKYREQLSIEPARARRRRATRPLRAARTI